MPLKLICSDCGRVCGNLGGLMSHVVSKHGPGSPWKGRRHTEEAKQKNRERHSGKKPWNYGLEGFRAGIPKSEEHKQKVRESLQGRHLGARDV